MEMKSDKFNWGIIANMGWGEAVNSNERRPYERMKREFMETYSEEVCKQFNEWYCKKYRGLVAEYDLQETQGGERYGNFGGDDSFGDMMDHVMGLGEKYYNAIMGNFKMLNELEPQESFAYAIPHTGKHSDDYKKMTAGAHQAQARRCVNALAATATGLDGISEGDFEIIRNTMSRMLLIIEGKFEEAVGDLDFNTDYNTFYEYEANENSALYANVLFDCKKYMV